jgi:hypothetical protein
MPYTGDPANSATDRIRLAVGDTDVYQEGLTDEVYAYLLSVNLNEARSTIGALKYLVAKYASYVTEKAGGLFIKESEKFEQYSKLLNRYTKDPSQMLLTLGTPFAGGISYSDLYSNASNPDNNLINATINLNEDKDCIDYL